MRRARTQKTRKAVPKRFKITGSGKIMRRRMGKRHLLASKSPKRRRLLGSPAVLDDTDRKKILECLPFSH